MVELFRIARDQSVLQVAHDTQADEVVVPNHVVRDHEETQELLGKQHLSLLVVSSGKS